MMPNVTSLVETLEKLAFEILMWIIFIPKTLIRVFIHPNWVSGYVKGELSKEGEERFKSYISPVFLLVVSSVVPYAASQIIPQTSVQLTGPQEGIVDQEYSFLPQQTLLWSTLPLNYYFDVSIYNAETNEFEILASDEKIIWDSKEISGANFAYTWQEPGDYWVYVYVENGMDEWAEYSHFISVYTEEEVYYLADSFVENAPGVSAERTSVKAATQSGLNRLSAQLKADQTISGGLVFFAFPLLFSVVIELFRKKSITRENLREMFYIQCLFFSPLYFGLSIILLTTRYYFPSETENFNSSEVLYGFSSIWFGIIILWFLFNQAKLVMAEFSLSGFSKWRGLGVFVLCIVASAVLSLLADLLSGNADASKLFAWNIYNWGFAALLLFGGYRFIRQAVFKRRAEDAAANGLTSEEAQLADT